MSFRIILCSAALLFVSTDAFSISATTKLQDVTRSQVQLRSSAPRHSDVSLSMQAGSDSMDRRSVIAAAAALFASVASPLKNANAAGLAFGYGANENDINAQLLAYSLPPIDKVPGGFKPLIQTIGGTVGANIDGSKVIESIGSYVTANGGLKSGERVLVLFNYPSSWIVSLPITTANGESGTVSANNYVKGDSAVVSAKVAAGNLTALPKEFFQDLLLQTVPKDQWQNFKLVKKAAAAATVDGAEAVDVEYRYDLITSGPIIGRHGFARCIRSGGNLIIALGANTADTRFKSVKDSLIATAASFRANIVKAEFSKADAN
eukprot:CAMPEP_0172180900 /NCGR_PEP_ID=MMETSP1050-20130122/17511_1 /TAXON_ID=233186 /ORGANISM="Cryptomonas curvata, Strain CCAP979/52" /LENGTH=319 /DNA_ID=CAMNT_0012854107 /DNA_START=6 /DNA_END=965 /DNA_ORIENTATION=+